MNYAMFLRPSAWICSATVNKQLDLTSREAFKATVERLAVLMVTGNFPNVATTSELLKASLTVFRLIKRFQSVKST